MTKQEIQNKLVANHKSFADYIISLKEADFLYSFQNKWSAGQQLEHMVRATSTLGMARLIPKFIIKLLLGSAGRSSASYEELVKNYQAKLANGAKASARYVPGKVNFNEKDKLITRLMHNASKISALTSQYTEVELDRYLLPHPIIGKLTIREMMYFAIYHVEHHHKLTKQYLALQNVNT